MRKYTKAEEPVKSVIITEEQYELFLRNQHALFKLSKYLDDIKKENKWH